MAQITINTKTFSTRSVSENAVEFLKDGATIAAPYTLKQSRTLAGRSATAVQRGAAKFTRVWTDAQGISRQAIIDVTSSIHPSISAADLADLEADVKAAVVVNGAVGDVLFRGKLNY